MSGDSSDHFSCTCDACGQSFEPTESMSVEHLAGLRPGDDESLIFLRCWGCERKTRVVTGGEC